jgi:hypothetical protein
MHTATTFALICSLIALGTLLAGSIAGLTLLQVRRWARGGSR